MIKQTGYDLNLLLVMGNLAVCAITACFYGMTGADQYVNFDTLILLCFFAAENILMLFYEQKHRDPFLLLLLTVSLLFYMLRVTTLLLIPWSLTLSIYSLTFKDVNYTLIFIMLANVSIFFGLSMAKGRIHQDAHDPAKLPAANFNNVMLILMISIFMSFSHMALNGMLAKAFNYVKACVDMGTILLLTAVYMGMHFRKLSDNKRMFFYIVIFIAVLLLTLSGSRSGLMVLAVSFLVALLSVKGKILLNHKMILMMAVIIPVSAFLFITATKIRQNVVNREVIRSEQWNFLVKSDFFNFKDIRLLCRPVFDRAGYLDFATILISNEERYRKIINPAYYLKSAIDNVFTPGFGVIGVPKIFDTPKVSNSMLYITNDKPLPTHEQINKSYQSDMLTVYGENYVLFYGYPALLVLFIFSLMFKKIYMSIRCKDAFLFFLYRAAVLYVFYLWILSYGMDWLLRDIIVIFFNIFLYKSFYKIAENNYSLSAGFKTA